MKSAVNNIPACPAIMKHERKAFCSSYGNASEWTTYVIRNFPSKRSGVFLMLSIAEEQDEMSLIIMRWVTTCKYVIVIEVDTDIPAPCAHKEGEAQLSGSVKILPLSG